MAKGLVITWVVLDAVFVKWHFLIYFLGCTWEYTSGLNLATDVGPVPALFSLMIVNKFWLTGKHEQICLNGITINLKDLSISSLCKSAAWIKKPFWSLNGPIRIKESSYQRHLNFYLIPKKSLAIYDANKKNLMNTFNVLKWTYFTVSTGSTLDTIFESVSRTKIRWT